MQSVTGWGFESPLSHQTWGGWVKVNIEELSATRRRLEVELPPERVKAVLEGVYKDLRRRVKIKGFRVGKAPLDLVKSLYRDLAHQEAVSKLIEETLPQALSEGGIKPLVTPQVEAGPFSPESSFTYKATVEVRPKVELRSYKGLKLRVKKPSDVTEEDVQRELERMREYAAQMRPVEDRDEVQRGDWVLVDFEAFDGDRPVREGKVENHLFEVGSGSMIPGFEEAIIGAKVGEQRELLLRMPEDHPREELAGKEILFRVRVKEIRTKVLPPLDDEFAKDLGYEDLKSLKAKVREELERRRSEEERAALRQAALERLLEENPFEVPPTLVEQRAAELFRRLEERSVSIPADKEAEVLEQCRRIAEREIKTAYLVEEIAKAEGVEIKDEEIEEHLNRGKVPEALRANEGFLSQVKGDLLKQKVFDLLIKEAQVEYIQ
ncbi:MAG: trigger factor [Deltaproteobacteria bacterium]|nr:MAG: trigger factor [Deltaproteobacteria bacterium]